MPRPDLTAIDGGQSFVTLTRPIAFLGRTVVQILLSEKPLQRRWLPRDCIVSARPETGKEATLRVPIGLAMREGLVRVAEMRRGGTPVQVTAPWRPGDCITLHQHNPSTGGDAA